MKSGLIWARFQARIGARFHLFGPGPNWAQFQARTRPDFMSSGQARTRPEARFACVSRACTKNLESSQARARARARARIFLCEPSLHMASPAHRARLTPIQTTLSSMSKMLILCHPGSHNFQMFLILNFLTQPHVPTTS